MKKQVTALFFSLIFITSLSITTSCSDESNTKEELEMVLEQNQIEELKALLANSIEVDGSLKRTLESYDFSEEILREYDFNKVKIIQSEGKSGVIINTKNFDIKNRENKAITLGYDIATKEFYGDPLIMQTINNSETLKTINISAIDSELLFTVELNQKEKDSKVVYANPAPKKKGCGTKVAECMVDAYSNYGWYTVTGWVLSAFVPETVALVALFCYDKNC